VWLMGPVVGNKHRSTLKCRPRIIRNACRDGANHHVIVALNVDEVSG